MHAVSSRNGGIGVHACRPRVPVYQAGCGRGLAGGGGAMCVALSSQVTTRQDEQTPARNVEIASGEFLSNSATSGGAIYLYDTSPCPRDDDDASARTPAFALLSVQVRVASPAVFVSYMDS